MNGFKNIVEKFKTGTLESWGHYEHIIVCLHYAKKTNSPEELMAHMRCALISFKAKTGKNTSQCAEGYSETITWFWVNKIFNFIKKNSNASEYELISEAEKKGFFKKDYLLKNLDSKILENPLAKYKIIETTNKTLYVTT